MQSIRNQALSLTAANAFTRALGFLMRMLLARMMSPEALGVMEMAHAAEMLSLTPVTAGTHGAMSRMTAQRPESEQHAVLHAGLDTIARTSYMLMAATFLSSPLICMLLGDERTLPALLVHTPCILLLGLGSVYQGWCFGRQDVRLPALSECIEQLVRIILAATLLIALRGSAVGMTAAIPGAAEVVAAACVLAVFAARYRPDRRRVVSHELVREFRSLAAPSVISRLCTTGLRACNAVLIPICLRMSGLTPAAATAQYGLLTGMAMPALMLPGMVTGALSTAAAPAVTSQSTSSARLRTLVMKLRRTSFLIGLGSAVLLIAASDLIASFLFRTPEAAPLIRLMSPSALMMSVQQVQYGAIVGLGLQRKQLTGSIAGSIATSVVIAFLTPMPAMRLYGAAVGMLCGQLVSLLWGWCVLSRGVSSYAATHSAQNLAD